ncbi:hypothetical protein [Nocardia aurea]|uniref:hypothetical protein n=1 Tax=Nocardia aurea TaxID=2144174 RepID=UPI0033BE745F
MNLKGTAVGWVGDDGELPGVIEVQLIDAEGTVHSLIDKVPIFGRTEDLGPDSTYPLPVDICVDLIERIDGDRALIELRWEARNTERTRYVVPSVDLAP